MAIVDGILSRANHELRVNGIESYKKYLSKKYYSEDDIIEAFKDIIECKDVIQTIIGSKELEDIRINTKHQKIRSKVYTVGEIKRRLKYIGLNIL